MKLSDLKNINVEATALAIEADEGEPISGLRDALAEVKADAAEGSRVTTPAQILVRQARSRSGMTQTAFAERIATPVATLRDWEQGRFVPPGAVTCLLRLIVKHPELAAELAA
ncbi:MAG: helix-turn-helix domain-containing protein [Betaproteobacteria bacterium]|nr:helix-turn-helix domain-containing protein [Betaproteobacteria bacterium]